MLCGNIPDHVSILFIAVQKGRQTLVKDDEAFEKEVKRCLDLEETCIKAGKTVCCYTTRALITADTGDKEDELRLSVKISDAV